MAGEKLVKRSQKLAFYGVTEGEDLVYSRMTGFTEFSKSANAQEYKRQYVDEEFERNDIVGYSPTYSYEFDRFADNDVHTDIAAVTDGEMTGTDAVRSIIVVDLSQEVQDGSFYAVKRDFSIIPDTEGGSTEAYTYSGSFKAAGDKVFGTASSSDNWATVVFTENA